MSMISKQQFDELVTNTTKYLQEHAQHIVRLEQKVKQLEARLAHIEQRKKPGPKPKAKAA